MKENLQALPQSLKQLVAYSLERLCSQYRHWTGLRRALAALTVSACGENFDAKMECKKRESCLEIKLFSNITCAKAPICSPCVVFMCCLFLFDRHERERVVHCAKHLQ